MKAQDRLIFSRESLNLNGQIPSDKTPDLATSQIMAVKFMIVFKTKIVILHIILLMWQWQGQDEKAQPVYIMFDRGPQRNVLPLLSPASPSPVAAVDPATTIISHLE